MKLTIRELRLVISEGLQLFERGYSPYLDSKPSDLAEKPRMPQKFKPGDGIQTTTASNGNKKHHAIVLDVDDERGMLDVAMVTSNPRWARCAIPAAPTELYAIGFVADMKSYLARTSVPFKDARPLGKKWVSTLSRASRTRSQPARRNAKIRLRDRSKDVGDALRDEAEDCEETKMDPA